VCALIDIKFCPTFDQTVRLKPKRKDKNAERKLAQEGKRGQPDCRHCKATFQPTRQHCSTTLGNLLADLLDEFMCRGMAKVLRWLLSRKYLGNTQPRIAVDDEDAALKYARNSPLPFVYTTNPCHSTSH
jgi:hypothetical protein